MSSPSTSGHDGDVKYLHGCLFTTKLTDNIQYASRGKYFVIAGQYYALRARTSVLFILVLLEK